MTPHREWFCEYERYDGGNVFLGDESTTKIIIWGKFKLRLIDGSIRTLPSVLHIPRLAINLIYVRKMDDAGVKIWKGNLQDGSRSNGVVDMDLGVERTD